MTSPSAAITARLDSQTITAEIAEHAETVGRAALRAAPGDAARLQCRPAPSNRAPSAAVGFVSSLSFVSFVSLVAKEEPESSACSADSAVIVIAAKSQAVKDLPKRSDG